jgi:mycobactin peptide synthetase MbtF
VAGAHPVLGARLRSGRDGGRAALVLGEPGPDVTVGRTDAARLAAGDLDQAAAAEARQACARLDPAAGVMLRATWLDAGPGRQGRLALAGHHLVVDAVSWRILLPDLEAAYTALAAGQEPALLAGGTSFRRWTQALAAQAAGQARVAELDRWSQILAAAEPRLGGRALDPARDTARSMRQIALTVPADRTAALVTELPAAFHCGVPEVLLAGLAAAVTSWRDRSGTGPVLVDVEGHGREPLAADMDLSRAVGCFTSSHPVRLETGGAVGGDLLKAVKEQARAVPGDGLGYGLLRYLNPETGAVLAARPGAQIGFNYLGRTSTSGKPGGGNGHAAAPWQPAGAAAAGGDTDPRLPAAHSVEASALVRDLPGGPELRLWLAWPATLLDEAAVEELGQDWVAALAGLAEHAAGPGAGGHTPSDFALVSLAQEQIEQLEAGLAADLTVSLPKVSLPKVSLPEASLPEGSPS